MRALRADVKKRELASMRTKLEDAEKAATEARERLHAKSAEARTMAAGLRAGAAELQGVHKSSLQWAGRAPTFPPGAGEGPRDGALRPGVSPRETRVGKKGGIEVF